NWPQELTIAPRRLSMRTLSFLALAVSLAACGGSTSQGPDAVQGDSTAGGESGPSVELPTEITPEILANGEDLFDRYCDTCHPGGEEDIGPNLRGIRWTVGAMETQIRDGSGKMKPIPSSRLSDEGLPDLMAFLLQMEAVRQGQ
ncbi:MAG: c-type cytochrome, partial [Myxococcales bacterium]|nr:c-type cytochrome [Myxococcales bacterium]